jgi:hypothetical protein
MVRFLVEATTLLLTAPGHAGEWPQEARNDTNKSYFRTSARKNGKKPIAPPAGSQNQAQGTERRRVWSDLREPAAFTGRIIGAPREFDLLKGGEGIRMPATSPRGHEDFFLEKVRKRSCKTG